MNKLVITSREDIVCYGYFRDGKAIELYCEKKKSTGLLGNIYVARVTRIAEGIQGAFLDLTGSDKGYCNLSPTKKPVKLSPGHEDRLYAGDLILVQVRKEGVGTKLPVVDTRINFTGKYFVFSMEKPGISISKKIKEKEERERLMHLAGAWIREQESLPYHIVIRTNARHTGHEELLRELDELKVRSDRLMQKARTAPEKTLLWEEAPFYLRLAKDLPFGRLDQILTDDPRIRDELKEYYQGEGERPLREKICFYEDDYPLYLLYRFDHWYDLALSRRIPLKSGGSIVIDTTEAMVVVDVNSGSVLKKKKEAETIFESMNKEAASEIIYQLRLRNLSGIILIDFINMKDAGSRERVLSALKKEAEGDRIPVRVIDFTALNLVEMTRNKVRKPLKDQWEECHRIKS